MIRFLKYRRRHVLDLERENGEWKARALEAEQNEGRLSRRIETLEAELADTKSQLQVADSQAGKLRDDVLQGLVDLGEKVGLRIDLGGRILGSEDRLGGDVRAASFPTSADRCGECGLYSGHRDNCSKRLPAAEPLEGEE